MKIEIVREWDKILDSFPEAVKDVYFKEAYVKLYEGPDNEAVCCVCVEADNILLFPFLRRSFIYNGVLKYDFETAYGYGGPISNTNSLIFIKKALKTFRTYCEENNYIAGFVRFHPLLNNQKLFKTIGEVFYDRQTVAINLTLAEEELWTQEIHTQNRNVIKKGIKKGLSFIVDNDYQYLEDFIELYNSTMKKLSANEFYFFERTYYDYLAKRLKNSFLGVVCKDNVVISAAIFIYSEKYGHYHLSGSDVNFLSLCPNNYMLYQAALELKRRGVDYLHLGGGTTSDNNDSLLKFKGRFSQQRYQFAIGKVVFNSVLYRQLCREWDETCQGNKEKYQHFLLKYKY